MTEHDARLIQWFRKQPESSFGDWGERFWSGVFGGCGLHYIPLCKMNVGGAPMLQGKGKIILPDYLVNAGPKIQVYVDSKAKRSPVYWRHGRENRHGIDRVNCEHYEDIGSTMGKHSALAIFEAFTDTRLLAWSGSMLLQTIWRLGKPINGFGSQEHMVYWPRHKFKLIGEVSPGQATRITTHHGEGAAFKDAIWSLFEIESAEPVQGILF